MFVGRERELKVLRDAWRAERSALVPIYGRRRVGKSELIRQMLKQAPGLHFVGQEAPPALQQRRLLEAAAEALNLPVLAQLETGDWRKILAAIVELAPGKIVLALDEFQWTAAASPELPSVIQELWDTTWSRDDTVVLILCGSFVGFMEREVLGHKSPLFGRRTAQIRLAPFGFREARSFHPGWSLTEIAKLRFVCGGVPAYLEAFPADRSVEQSLVRLVFDEFGRLHREPEFLLREELREVGTYYAILMALATGSARARDIAAFTGVTERNLPYYLGQLAGMHYVRKRHPLTGEPPSRRKVRYALSDPLLRFWFRFVWPNASTLAQLGPERTFATRVKPHLPAFFGSCFEDLCREALPALYEAEGVTAAWEVGEYWDRDTQIDVVGVRDDGWIDLGECRWGSPGPAARELAQRALRYPNPRGSSLNLRVFARHPGATGDLAWHTLADLYGEGGGV